MTICKRTHNDMQPTLFPRDVFHNVHTAGAVPGNGYSESPTVGRGEFTFYEFFAGGGMARAGLGARWKCLFANDFDFKKSASYRLNWGDSTIKTEDVGRLTPTDVPGVPHLVWASFPCQDLSLAGMGAGLRGDRSGTFWPFWSLVGQLAEEGRGPRLLVLENVCGTLTSHAGRDFTAIADALSQAGYRFGAVVVDAVAFVPQSRPRLFIIAVSAQERILETFTRKEPSPRWHTKALRLAHSRLSGNSLERWVWWKLPTPPKRTTRFSDLVEQNPTGVSWHTPDETERLLSMMSAVNRAKIEKAKRAGMIQYGTVYKRTRYDESGAKVQRAEVRFDNVAGCLRTSSGGSSRQLVVVVNGNEVRSRLISTRETARLMGLPDSYRLPQNYNEAYHLTGDGVVVSVVRFLSENLLEPILVARQDGLGGTP